ncbi:MAG TPA: acyltransferase [Casimicrobiaceae bacterium]
MSTTSTRHAINVVQLDALTGSRFVASFAILVLHGAAFGYSLPPWLDLAQAVSYFFVLSGFILGYRYPQLPDHRAVARFYWARFARIWPIHFFCLMLGVATVPAAFWASADGATWSILPLQILLVNAWIPIERFVFGFNPPAWTISVECFFYIAYPVLIFRWNATWQWKLAGSGLLMLALALIGYVAALPAATTPEQQNQVSTLALLYGNPLARLFEFTLGMTAAMVWHRSHTHLQFSFGIATALEVALLCAIVGDLYWTGHQAAAWGTKIGRPGFDWRVLTATPLGTAACLLYAPLILLLAAGKGLVAKLLARPIAVVLGEASYSLYMLQAVMLVPVIRNPQWFETWSVGERVIIGFMAIVIAALLLWWFVERPSRRWLLRRQPASWHPQPVASI